MGHEGTLTFYSWHDFMLTFTNKNKGKPLFYGEKIVVILYLNLILSNKDNANNTNANTKTAQKIMGKTRNDSFRG